MLLRKAHPTPVAMPPAHDPGFLTRQGVLLREERDALRRRQRSRHLAATHLHEELHADFVDQAQSDATEEILSVVSGIDRQRLWDLEDALLRMEKGVYGLCLGCGQRISQARLEALPATPCCLPCQESSELEAALASDRLGFRFSDEIWSQLNALS